MAKSKRKKKSKRWAVYHVEVHFRADQWDAVADEMIKLEERMKLPKGAQRESYVMTKGCWE
jgi:hypothetical protein